MATDLELVTEAARGIPAGVAMRLLNVFTPGHDWRGMAKGAGFELALSPAGAALTNVRGYVKALERLRAIVRETPGMQYGDALYQWRGEKGRWFP